MASAAVLVSCLACLPALTTAGATAECAAAEEGRHVGWSTRPARESVLIQRQQLRHARQNVSSAILSVEDPLQRCQVGDSVQCPGSQVRCLGEMCCPGEADGPNFPCPSAPRGWGPGRCQNPVKVQDCTPEGPAEPPTSSTLTTTVLASATMPPGRPPHEDESRCTAAGASPWVTGSRLPCCTGLQECEASSLCLQSCTDANEQEIRLMSFNVWYRNNHFAEIANLIQDEVDPDIVNLQEAVEHQPAAIIEALNAKRRGEWRLANSFGYDHYWCGLNAYRADRWDVEWTKEVAYQSSRGICGARLRRKADGTRLCVWGTHPTWLHGAPANSAEEGVRAAALAMKECASGGGVATAMMCDCNTMDTSAVTRQLAASTSWNWQVAYADGYDQIYIQSSVRPRHTADSNTSGLNVRATSATGHTIAPYAGRRGCQADCQNAQWAGADHPPVVADVYLR